MFPVPVSLSPSRVESFTTCPMAFRFASIEKLPEPPSVHTTKGSFVHRVLELLFTLPNAQRSADAAAVMFEQTKHEYAEDPEFTMLDLSPEQVDGFHRQAWQLVQNYFSMEDPTRVRDIGLELRLEAPVDDLMLRGIIDRLELDNQGQLIVTDYKTGRPPGQQYEQARLSGVHFYSFLCEAVLGQRPAAIRLMYLSNGETLTALPSEKSVRFITSRTAAVWKAIERACVTGDFRPRTSKLCDSCAFKPWCPAFGGNPDLAAVEAPARFGLAA